MPKKNGVVSIGLEVTDYQKSIKTMVTSFRQAMTQISNDVKKTDWSSAVETDISEIKKELKEVSDITKNLNENKLSTAQFEKYQSTINSRMDKIVDKVSILSSKLEELGNVDISSKIKVQLDDLKSVYGDIAKIVSFEETKTNKINKNDNFDDIINQANKYKKILKDLREIETKYSPSKFRLKKDHTIEEATKAVGLYRQVADLREQVATNIENKEEDLAVAKGEKRLAIEEEILKEKQKVVALDKIIASLYDDIYKNTPYEFQAKYESILKKGRSHSDESEIFESDVNKWKSTANEYLTVNEKIIASGKETKEALGTVTNEFKLKDGAIFVPIELNSNISELNSQLDDIQKKVQKHADKTPVIAKVKLTLDGDSSKQGYKTIKDTDKQNKDGQNKPSIDISKVVKKTYAQAIREAEEVARAAILTIQNEFKNSPIKITPDKQLFTDELKAMVNSSLAEITNETSGLNVNNELKELVASLKEVSTALSGTENFKLGLDEASIKRITDAIENMANMIKRAFGVASDSDIAAQWAVIEEKFKSVAGEEGKLLVGNKEHKAVIQELAVEYKKYLDMGGTNELSSLIKHSQTVKNITKAYEKLNAEAKETQDVLDQNAVSKNADVTLTPITEGFKANADKLLDEIPLEKEVKLTIGSTKDDIKGTTKANKNLETQAEKTEKAVKNESTVAETASAKFRKLAKEKGAAVVANRELADAAERTARALKEEAEAKKASGGTKSNKNAVDATIYNSNFLKWQNEIKQSLLDSGNYAEVYDAKINQLANGTVKFTAVIRELDGELKKHGELKKFSATVDNLGKISSPSISDMSEKQAANFEKELFKAEKIREAMAAMDLEDTEFISLKGSEMKSHVATIIEATQALEDLNTKYKVSLKSDGGLTITKELKEASGETKLFTANFKSVDDVISAIADGAKSLGDILEDSFDSGKFVTSTKNLAREAQNLLDKFKLKNEGDSNFKAIEEDLSRLQNQINTSNFSNGLDGFKNDLSEIGVKLKNIKTNSELGKLFNTTHTFKDIYEVRNSLNSLFSTMGKVNEKSIRVKNMKTLTADIKQANGEIHKMTVNLDKDGFARFVDNGIIQFNRLREVAENVFKGISSLVRIYLSPQDFIRYFRQGFDEVKEIDTAMTELRKVSDAPAGDIATYFDDAVVSAKELGSSVNDMISATADWSRNGYNLPDSKELAEVAVLYKNVGDGIDIDTANSSLVSTLQGFQLDASEAIDIVDKFNEVANNYAIDSAGIGEALKRSSAAFNAANTDLSKSIALVTATNEVIQNPEKVGTLFTTLSARIRGSKTDLEELGEDIDDVMSTSKLQALVKGMTNFDIMESDGKTYKDIYEIVLGIGEEWDKLTDVNRASLLEALAGKRQSNALAAVLGNLDTLRGAYETAEQSSGSAQREQQKYMDSLQYSLDQLTAHGEEFWSTFINKDDVKEFIDLINTLISGATKLVDTFGSIPTVTGILGGFAAIKNVGINMLVAYLSNRDCFELPTI